MYMPNYLPWPQAQQSSTQAEREELAMQRQDLEARELEVERKTRALNLTVQPPPASPRKRNRAGYEGCYVLEV